MHSRRITFPFVMPNTLSLTKNVLDGSVKTSDLGLETHIITILPLSKTNDEIIIKAYL